MRTKRHRVLIPNPHIKSPAAAILLCLKYRKLELLTYLTFRSKILSAYTDDELMCVYCKKKNLLRDLPDHVVRQPHNLATIDHVIPISKGGPKYSPDNCVVACYSCNQKKRDTIL